MEKVNINLRLYGILSSYMQDKDKLSLSVPATLTVPELAQCLHAELAEHHKDFPPEKIKELMQLINSSAFAKDDLVLDGKAIALKKGDSIDVLPPVCGG